MSNIRQTLLEITQDILMTGLDSDTVNSISDTEEATQVANIVKNTYFDMVSRRIFPEQKELTKLDSIADSTRPCYLKLPTNVRRLDRFEYNVSEDSNVSYREIMWKDPEEFLDWTRFRDVSDQETTTMLDINGNTSIVIRNNKMPSYFTSFDDEHVVCDAYKSTIDDVLQTSKTRAYVTKMPTFSLEDSFVPDINDVHFRMLVNEAKSTAVAVIQKTINPALAQSARDQKVHTQNDRTRFQDRESLQGFGRKRHR